MTVEVLVERIVEQLDRNLMLGAAWDCLTETQQGRFKQQLTKIIGEAHDQSDQS